jgi:hypothetical protein
MVKEIIHPEEVNGCPGLRMNPGEGSNILMNDVGYPL